jgi:hypothetical protein
VLAACCCGALVVRLLLVSSTPSTPAPICEEGHCRRSSSNGVRKRANGVAVAALAGHRHTLYLPLVHLDGGHAQPGGCVVLQPVKDGVQDGHQHGVDQRLRSTSGCGVGGCVCRSVGRGWMQVTTAHSSAHTHTHSCRVSATHLTPFQSRPRCT